MCLKNNCKYIEIIEIHDNIKIVIHYDDDRKPILIQYWDERKSPYQQFLFEEKKDDYAQLKQDIIDLELTNIIDLDTFDLPQFL